MEQEVDVLPCADKIAFDSVKAAKTAATVADYHYGSVLRPYHCRHCHLWHITSN